MWEKLGSSYPSAERGGCLHARVFGLGSGYELCQSENDANVGLYIVGEPVQAGSATPIGYSRFTTSTSLPTWLVGTNDPGALLRKGPYIPGLPALPSHSMDAWVPAGVLLISFTEGDSPVAYAKVGSERTVNRPELAVDSSARRRYYR